MYYFEFFHRSKSFQVLLAILLACFFNASFLVVAQEEIGSFVYTAYTYEDGYDGSYITTESIEGGPDKAYLSWNCAVLKDTQGNFERYFGIATALFSSQQVEVGTDPSDFNSNLISVSYLSDGQNVQEIEFIVLEDKHLLVLDEELSKPFGMSVLSSSTFRLEFTDAKGTNFNYLFDVTGFKEALSKLPCASYVFEKEGLTVGEVFNEPVWLKSVEEKMGSSVTYLKFEFPDGSQEPVIIVNNTGSPPSEGSLVLKCKPTGDSEEGNFEAIITRSQWQSGEGFTKARPLTNGETSLRVTINRRGTRDPKRFNFSSYESGEIYYYDSMLHPYMSITLRTTSQIIVDFQTTTFEEISYSFDLTEVSKAMPNLPCLSPNLIVRAWKNITGDSEYGYLSDGSDEDNVDFEFYADGTGKTSQGDSFTWEVDEVGFVRATIGDSQVLFKVITPNFLESGLIMEMGLFGSAQYVPMSDEERAEFEAFASAPVVTDQGTGETVENDSCIPSDPLNVQGSFESRSKEYERWTTCAQKESISPLVAAAIEGYFGLASRLTNQLENNEGLFALSDADTFLNELSNTIYQANSQSYSNVLKQNALVSPLAGEILDSPLQWAIDQARFEQGVAENFIKNNGASQVGFLNITVTLYLPIVSDAVGASLDMIAGLPPYIYEAFPEYRWAWQQMGSLSYEDRNTREAIGIAAIFINFGLSQEQYEKYMTDGVLPQIP